MRRFGRSVRGISWSVVAAGLLVGALGSPALATSCVMHEDASPAAILAGEERLAIGGGFAEHYRGAVLATVTDIDTDEREGSATYGSTIVRMDVLGTYGEVAADQARVEMPDPGWMLGYSFEPGATYFVPIRHEPTDVMACEPITLVPDGEVDGLVAQLDTPAEGQLLTVAAGAITAEPAAAESDGGAGVPPWLWVAVAGVVVVGAIGVTALVTRD
ncbi:MAG TPA: hypothetical protein VK906_01250 [Egicoccus sp.]|nr:hypothetical protein [Egicoccus sp.]HSK21765.1 hypothetical protein [Egicoccus sp.]